MYIEYKIINYNIISIKYFLTVFYYTNLLRMKNILNINSNRKKYVKKIFSG